MLAYSPSSQPLTSLNNAGLLRHRRSLGWVGLAIAGLVVLGLTLEVQASPPPQPSQIEASRAQRPLFPAPGRYLFGQVPEPDQLGHGYMVVDTTEAQTYGVLYFPSSSFDCFQGQIQGSTLAMTVINAYSQEAYPYSIALTSATTVATEHLASDLQPLHLEGFYPLDAPSQNDLRMLNICQGVVFTEL